MNDRQLAERLRGLDRPVTPDASFAEGLYATLERRALPGRRPSFAPLLAAALLAAAAIAGAIAVGSQLLRDDAVVVAPDATKGPQPSRFVPTTNVPAGYTTGATVPFAITLATDGVLLTGNADDATVVRRDAATFAELQTHQLGKAGDFPPNVQSLFVGTGGVWVTLGFDRSVILLDPVSGETTRTVAVLAFPYDVVESDGDLWIADVEGGQIIRYDLATDTEEAVIRGIQKPTDLVVGDGAVWAPAHIGRTQPDEPIGAGGYVARIDPATNEVDGQPKVGPRPYYAAAGFGGVWTGTGTGGSVDRVDAESLEVTTIWIGEDGAFDVEVVGDSVWAVVGPQWPVERLCDPATSYFVRIDPETRRVREVIAFPCASGITPMGDGFWVSGLDGDEPLSTYFEPTG